MAIKSRATLATDITTIITTGGLLTALEDRGIRNDVIDSFVSRLGDTMTGNYTLTGDWSMTGAFGVIGASTLTGALTVSGLTGIGTLSPNVKLTVLNSGTLVTPNTDVVILAQNSTTTGTNSRINIVSGNAAQSILEFGDSDDSDVGAIQYYHADNSIRFRTNNTNHSFAIDSTGRLGIGITSLSSLVHFKGSDSSGSTLSLRVDSSTVDNMFTINNAGFIGINTATQSASEKLRVNGNQILNGTLLLDSASDVTTRWFRNVSNVAAGTSHYFDFLNSTPAQYTAARIDVVQQVITAGVEVARYMINTNVSGTVTEAARFVNGRIGVGGIDPTEVGHFNGNIKTSQGTLVAAGSWKLGTLITSTVTLNTDEYVEIEIGGTVTRLATVDISI